MKKNYYFYFEARHFYKVLADSKEKALKILEETKYPELEEYKDGIDVESDWIFEPLLTEKNENETANS